MVISMWPIRPNSYLGRVIACEPAWWLTPSSPKRLLHDFRCARDLFRQLWPLVVTPKVPCEILGLDTARFPVILKLVAEPSTRKSSLAPWPPVARRLSLVVQRWMWSRTATSQSSRTDLATTASTELGSFSTSRRWICRRGLRRPQSTFSPRCLT